MMTSRSSVIERLRAELIRRARTERQGDLEQARSGPHPSTETTTALEGENPTAQSTRLRMPPLRLPTFLQIFGGKAQSERHAEAGDEVLSPKSPEFVSRRPPTLPPMHLDFQSLSDTFAPGNDPSRSPSPPHPSSVAPSSVYSQPTAMFEPPQQPYPATLPSSRGSSPRLVPLSTPDPAEQALAQLGVDGRRRRKRRQRRAMQAENTQRQRSSKPPPTRFLYCFPWVKSRRMRSQILRCFVAGTFLTVLLAVYLALTMTKSINSGEFTIVLILIVLCATVFFCHALLRVFLLMYRGDLPSRGGMGRTQHYLSPGGYAVPQEPIPVVLAQDEDVREAAEDVNKITPPAYGLWRGSVRADPNRLFWQRNDTLAAGARPETRTGPRPPSYASDDGVSYVVNAAPRSTAPMTEVPLPPHPSEAGRVYVGARW